MTREEVFEKFARTAETWRQNPDLVRKYYLFDAANGVAASVYLWRARADAEIWHGADFRSPVRDIYGAEPESRFFETPIIVDGRSDEVVDDSEHPDQ